MALKRAVRTGGDFLDLKQLVRDSNGECLAIFRIKEFQASEKATGFEGLNLPVIADVLVCSGPRSGEVHLGERFIGAITSALRGVRNPKVAKGETEQAPVNEVGDEIVTRLKILNPNAANAGVVGDEPSDAECDAIEKIYDDGKAWAAGEAAAEKPKETVAAGGGKKRPW